MIEFSYKVTDEHGIHARPAGLLVKCAKMFESDIKVSCESRHADAKHLLSVMSMGVRKDETLDFYIEGTDEKLAAQELLSYCRKFL